MITIANGVIRYLGKDNNDNGDKNIEEKKEITENKIDENIKLKIKEKINKIETVFDLKREFEIFQIGLDVFVGLEIGTKIGKYNNDIDGEYEKYIPSYYQKITRWYYDENRFKTIDYINHDFDNFTTFLQNVLNKLEDDKFNLYGSIVGEINVFVKEIIKGLYNLKNTYGDYKKMEATIDSIILTLLDFKKNSENQLEYNLKHKYKNIPNTLKIITKSNSYK